MNKMRKMMKSESGQGMTEYIIIVALIAIACIGVVTIFGDNIRKIFGASIDALNGQNVASTGTRSASTLTAKKIITNFGKDTQG